MGVGEVDCIIFRNAVDFSFKMKWKVALEQLRGRNPGPVTRPSEETKNSPSLLRSAQSGCFQIVREKLDKVLLVRSAFKAFSALSVLPVFCYS